MIGEKKLAITVNLLSLFLWPGLFLAILHDSFRDCDVDVDQHVLSERGGPAADRVHEAVGDGRAVLEEALADGHGRRRGVQLPRGHRVCATLLARQKAGAD